MNVDTREGDGTVDITRLEISSVHADNMADTTNDTASPDQALPGAPPDLRRDYHRS
ncbi:MAG: hypothetical protein ACT4P0_12180 [Panacagrimonas sp.]